MVISWNEPKQIKEKPALMSLRLAHVTWTHQELNSRPGGKKFAPNRLSYGNVQVAT